MTINFFSVRVFFGMSLALALAVGPPLRADTYLETFDGPLNPAIWTVNTGGNDWTISGGKLTITRTNNNNGRMEFFSQLGGDFQVQFDYRHFWTTNPFGFGDRLQLDVNTDLPNQHVYAVGHTQGSPGNVFGVAVDPGARFEFLSGPTPTFGTMRISRVGSNVSMDYFNLGTWVTLQTGNDTRDMSVGLSNYVFQGYGDPSVMEIDNFQITADRFTAVPEPGSLAVLLGGFGLASCHWRRRKA
jgi:hypothetical protein